MLAVADAYVARHPDEQRGLEALAVLYSNAGSYFSARLKDAAGLERATSLLERSIATSERLIALHPDEAGHRENASIAHFNLGNLYSAHARYAEAIPHFERAAADFAARAADGKDARAQVSKALNDSELAWALYKIGRIADAEKAMRANTRELKEMAAHYDDTQTRFALGRVRVRLAVLLVDRHRRQEARALLIEGRDGLRAVNAVFKLEGSEREPLDTAETLLAQLPQDAK
jgi:tetratricopeptide (TPR) repeat protein